MTESKTPTVQEEYAGFVKNYLTGGTTTAEDIGKQISRMAQHFGDANTDYAEALIAYNIVASSIEQTTDGTDKDGNDKAISSAKAKILATATPESGVLIRIKAIVENIEQQINALKSLQKGVLKEQIFDGGV